MVKLTLKEYMMNKGISATFVHEKTGIRYATILDMIHGNRGSVNLKHLGQIMNALRINDISLIMEKVEVAS